MTNNPDYEPLPLEATAPLLDAVQEPVRRIHDLLEEVEQAARDGDVDAISVAFMNIRLLTRAAEAEMVR